jgi:Guanylate-kinase-associated protein (GKAP) protein
VAKILILKLMVSDKVHNYNKINLFFLGLCENNICRSPDELFETKPEDLQGFWDMVMIQVDHVDSLFQEIELIKANDWKVRQ